ncbi:hypothetical protein D3C76_903540 [compost metagenome]
MGRLPGQVGDVLALLGHVVQHQHDARHLAIVDDRRTDQIDRHRAAVQSLNQPGVLGPALEAAIEHLLDQAAALLLGVFVHQAEQRRQRQAQRLTRLPVGELLSGRIHVADAAIDIGGDDRIANGLQGDLRPFLFFLQGTGECLALGQQFVGSTPGDGDEEQRRQQVGDQQHPQQHSRALAQGIAEGFGSRGHALVDGDDARLPVADLAGGRLATDKSCAHLPGDHIELGEVVVADVPIVDRRLQVAHMAKVAVEPDDAIDIFRVVAALQDGAARGFKIRVGLIEQLTQLVIPMRHGDHLAIALVRRLVTVVGIEIKVIDGVFLGLGPQAFARHIGSYCR